MEQQPHLDAYTRREISPEALMEEYSKSEEGFDLLHYLPLIDLAREVRREDTGGRKGE